MIRILAALLALAFAGEAAAQTLAPFAPASPATIGTSATQVLPVGPRRRVIFFNPNATAVIAFCPVLFRGGTALTCTVNGTGSITLVPLGTYVIDGGTPSGPPLAMSSAWNAISDTGASKYTIYEFE